MTPKTIEQGVLVPWHVAQDLRYALNLAWEHLSYDSRPRSSIERFNALALATHIKEQISKLDSLMGPSQVNQ